MHVLNSNSSTLFSIGEISPEILCPVWGTVFKKMWANWKYFKGHLMKMNRDLEKMMSERKSWKN